MYSANMALLSITYGYKIHIMLFLKHQNTKEAFQKNNAKGYAGQFEKNEEINQEMKRLHVEILLTKRLL